MAKKTEVREQYKAVVERRRSSAAGTHGWTKGSPKVDRANKRRKAIDEGKRSE